MASTSQRIEQHFGARLALVRAVLAECDECERLLDIDAMLVASGTARVAGRSPVVANRHVDTHRLRRRRLCKVSMNEGHVAFLDSIVAKGVNAAPLREIVERHAHAAAGDRVEAMEYVKAAGESRVVVHGHLVPEHAQESWLALAILVEVVDKRVEGLVDHHEVFALVQQLELLFEVRCLECLFQRVLRTIPVERFGKVGEMW